MAILPFNSTYVRTFKMVSNSTLISGITPNLRFAKAGSSSFFTPSGTVAEMNSGWYKVSLTAGDLNVFGDLSFYATGAGADDTDWVDQVGYNITNTAGLGLVYLDTNILSRLGTVNTAANWSALAINAAGRIDVGLFSGFAVDTGSTNRPTVNVDFVRSASINLLKSGRLDVDGSAVATTAGTVNDKTGYSLSQTFPTNFSSLSIDANGRVLYANTVNLLKNVAFNNFPFFMVDSSDHVSPRTGAILNVTRSLNGGSFGATANTATEIGNGWYQINLGAADLNANSVAVRFVGTGCDVTNIGIIPNI